MYAINPRQSILIRTLQKDGKQKKMVWKKAVEIENVRKPLMAACLCFANGHARKGVAVYLCERMFVEFFFNLLDPKRCFDRKLNVLIMPSHNDIIKHILYVHTYRHGIYGL